VSSYSSLSSASMRYRSARRTLSAGMPPESPWCRAWYAADRRCSDGGHQAASRVRSSRAGGEPCASI
jgi:hypothetical protein